MNCDEFRRRGILAEGEANLPGDVRLHFSECMECQTYLRENKGLRAEVRKLAESEHAPQALQQSVAELFREPRFQKRQDKRRWARVAATVVLLCGTTASYLWYRHSRTPSPERFAQAFISDRLHYLSC